MRAVGHFRRSQPNLWPRPERLILAGLRKIDQLDLRARFGYRDMTLDKSLKVKRGANRNRSVMTRVERLERLKEADRWKDGDSPLGLPKVRVRKMVIKKKKKKKEEEGAEGAAAPAAGAAAQRRCCQAGREARRPRSSCEGRLQCTPLAEPRRSVCTPAVALHRRCLHRVVAERIVARRGDRVDSLSWSIGFTCGIGGRKLSDPGIEYLIDVRSHCVICTCCVDALGRLVPFVHHGAEVDVPSVVLGNVVLVVIFK